MGIVQLWFHFTFTYTNCYYSLYPPGATFASQSRQDLLKRQSRVTSQPDFPRSIVLLGRGTTGAAAIAGSLTTVVSEREGVGRGVLGSGVDANEEPREDTRLDGVAEEDIIEDRVRGRLGRLLRAEDTVRSVLGELLRVGVVRGEGLDHVDELLIPEELADVRGCTSNDGAVGGLGGVLMDNDVQVGSTTSVVAGELGGEGNDTIGVRLLETAESSVVQVRGVGAVAVHVGLHTGVYTSGIGAPDVEVRISERLAGGDINKLGLEDNIHTRLIVADIGANIFSEDIEGTDLTLRVEDGGPSRSEDS